jgi:hypothetical protein
MVRRKDAAGWLASILVIACGCSAIGVQSSGSPPRVQSARMSGAVCQVPSPEPPSLPPPPAPTAAPAANPIQQAGARTKPPAAPEPNAVAARTQPTPTAPNNDSPSQVRTLYRQAVDRFARVDSYIARFKRRERVNGREKPEEVMLFKFRKQPWSVYFKWLGTEGQGREVVYVSGQHGSQIHTLLAAGDMPLAPAGKRISLSPDNVFVRAASSHSITESGIGYLIEDFGRLVDRAERDPGFGSFRFLGRISRPEFPYSVDGVEQIVPAAKDRSLPQGGRRLWVFDPAYQLPVLVVTLDQTGREVDYFCYDRIQFPVRLDDADFDPDQLWPPKPKTSAP